MNETSKRHAPEQVPGDAESQPTTEANPAIERSVRHPDKTEPVQTPQTKDTPHHS